MSGWCESCGGDAPRRPRFGRADVDACDACGAWAWTGAVPAAPAELYGDAYFTGGEYASYATATASHARNFRRKLDVLRRCGLEPRGARLLELGCATGEFLAVARDAGVPSLLGVEPSAYCRDLARVRGLDVRDPADPGLAAAVEALAPNLVVAWDVWEHLPTPVTALREVLARTRGEVWVAITTVDASSWVARLRGDSWRQFHPPTHLHYPTRASFRRLFERLGLRIRVHRAFGYYRPLREYLRVLRVNAAPGARWAELPLYLNLFDTQLVIAQGVPRKI